MRYVCKTENFVRKLLCAIVQIGSNEDYRPNNDAKTVQSALLMPLSFRGTGLLRSVRYTGGADV